MIGTKVAHYEITSHLGSGGMGDVYQATDSKLCPLRSRLPKHWRRAHDKGIVHRDLKPANIKVTPFICHRSRPAGNRWTSVPTCGRSERCCMRCSSARRLLTASQFQILWPFRFALMFSSKHFGQKGVYLLL